MKFDSLHRFNNLHLGKYEFWDNIIWETVRQVHFNKSGFLLEHSLYWPTTMGISLCDYTDNRIFQYRWKVTLNPLFLEHRWKEKPAQQITRAWPCNNHTIHSKSWWLEFYCTYFFPFKNMLFINRYIQN